MNKKKQWYRFNGYVVNGEVPPIKYKQEPLHSFDQ